MNKKKLVAMIGFILIFFVLIKLFAINLCDPVKNTAIGSFVEHNTPKISNETLDELRRIWLTLSSKICPKPVNQKF
ncbi:hypothetical protein G6723_01670 [Polynucleobacter paneuropaeus]|nr:hypothetical protein G6723_01670 [Polynucleobacter paneuropaeus]